MNQELFKWNQLVKQQDGIYHRCARACGLPDAQFWVLYALCETPEPLCQNSFCDSWCYSKQTINTAVAALEKRGLITLTFAPGSRKQKDVSLTEEGEVFCRTHIRTVQSIEEKVLGNVPKEEKKAFFRTFAQLMEGLEQELDEEGRHHAQ